MLTRDQIKNRRPKIEAVPAPELGEGATIGVRLLSAAEFMALSAKAKEKPEIAYAHWIIACACDEQGSPIFTADELDDAAGLAFPLVNRFIDAAQRLNGTSTAAAGNA